MTTTAPNQRRRPRGTGTVYKVKSKNGSTRFRAEITATIDGENRRWIWRFPTEEEAHARLDAVVIGTFGSSSVEAQATQATTDTSVLTLGEFATQWLEEGVRTGDISPRVEQLYRSQFKTRWQPLWNLKLGNIGKANLQAFVDGLSTPTSAGREAPKYITQLGYMRTLKAVLNAAQKKELVKPFLLQNMPTPVRARNYEEAPILEEKILPDDVRALMVAQLGKGGDFPCSRETHREGTCQAEWYLAFVSALRLGERTGLMRKDVTLDTEVERDGPLAGEVRVKGGILRIRRHAERTLYQHGCGAVNDDGSYPCGKKQGAACSKPVSTAKGETGMHLVAGTKSRRKKHEAERVFRIPLDATTASLLWTHLRVMDEEGLKGDNTMLFGGSRPPKRPIRGKRQSDEVYAEKVAAWEKALNEYTRDPATIRTPDQDLNSWRKVLAFYAPRLDVNSYGVHSIRHTTLTWLAMTTSFSMHQIAALANHADPKTTQRYIDLRAAKLEGMLAATTRAGREYARETFDSDFDAMVLAKVAGALERVPDSDDEDA